MGIYVKKPIEVEAFQISNIDSKYNENHAFNLWINIIKDIKKQYSNYEYNQNKFEIFKSNDYEIKSRLDCSGYVYACLSCFLKKNLSGNSSSLATISIDGFENILFTSFNDLKEGDIIVAPGQHTEIFAFKDEDKFKSWSVGKNGIKNSSYGDSNLNYSWKVIKRPIFNNYIDDIPEWINKAINNGDIIIENDTIKVNSLEGVMKGKIDDYVVKGIKDELYICEKNIFEETYEKIK